MCVWGVHGERGERGVINIEGFTSDSEPMLNPLDPRYYIRECSREEG